MCGILGIHGHTRVSQTLYDGLVLLQHRGQDAAGIVTCGDGRIDQRRGNGLVRDVFESGHLHGLRGNTGIGHVRYPTAGSGSESEAQPFYVNSPYGIALAHNGNLTNSGRLIAELFDQDRRHINTESDSEILLNVFAHELLNQRSLVPGPREVFNAVSRLHHRCRGAYAGVALLAGFGLLAFRDPHGIRPLIYGVRETAAGPEYLFASESVALKSFGFDIVRDVAPGEAIYIDRDGELYAEQCARSARYHGCIFEYVYFARPDSVIDEVFVHKARMRMGENLADKVKRQWPGHDIDVVIPVPDTSRTAALEFAVRLGLRYREGFIKNRYIGRTFIMPWQTERQKSVRQKLNPLDMEFKDKNVLLVDDIQFFADKEQSQEEFFHTFNTLFQSQSQIIMTCDCYPAEVEGLQERLKSRFGWGLTQAIEPPGLETRVAILQSKARHDGVALPDEVANYIAENIRSNIRELEGALRRVIANASFTSNPITIEFARDALRDLIATHNRILTIEKIQKTAADYYSIRPNEMVSPRRNRTVVRPRQMAMALAKDLTNHSLPEIGEAFGGRDHTTVIHACRKIKDLRQENTQVEQEYKDLTRILNG